MSGINKLEKVVAYLKTNEVQACYKGFEWRVPKDLDVFLGKIKSKEIHDKKGIERNHLFFEKMNEYHTTLKSDDRKRELCLWIIKKWGGIRNVNPDIFDTANDNLLRLENGEDIYFDRIASWSKYLTIVNPEKFAIYDTRIAYCLNTLKIVYGLDSKYFPMPSGGRNKVINSIMMDTVINLIGIFDNNRTVLDQKDFTSECYSKGESYREYLKLLKVLNNKIYGTNKNNRLYRIESLLFSISLGLIPDLLVTALRKKYAKS